MIGIITALLPLASNLTPVLLHLITHIRAQSGMTTDEIFAAAGVTLEENDKKLIEDLIRLGAI